MNAPKEEIPIACTLGAEQQSVRTEEFRAVFAHLIATETAPGGFVWRFADMPGLEARLNELAAKEHDCCRFFEFRIARKGSELVWETKGDARVEAVVEELGRLPIHLGSTDIASLKQVMGGAGLTFTADGDGGAR